MNKLPTETIFGYWLEFKHPEIDQKHTDQLMTIYRYFRSPYCNQAKKLNDFISEISNTETLRKANTRIINEFIHEIKTNYKSFKPQCHGFIF